MSGKSQPPYQGPPASGSVKQQRGNKNNSQTKPSAIKRKQQRTDKELKRRGIK